MHRERIAIDTGVRHDIGRSRQIGAVVQIANVAALEGRQVDLDTVGIVVRTVANVGRHLVGLTRASGQSKGLSEGQSLSNIVRNGRVGEGQRTSHGHTSGGVDQLDIAEVVLRIGTVVEVVNIDADITIRSSDRHAQIPNLQIGSRSQGEAVELHIVGSNSDVSSRRTIKSDGQCAAFDPSARTVTCSEGTARTIIGAGCSDIHVGTITVGLTDTHDISRRIDISQDCLSGTGSGTSRDVGVDVESPIGTLLQ